MKKPFYKRIWFWVLILIIVTFAFNFDGMVDAMKTGFNEGLQK